MNYTLNLFLQNGVNIPLWTAIIAPFGLAFVAFITAYATYRFNKPKTTAERRAIESKTRETDARGFEFQSQAFKDAQRFIDDLSQSNTELKRQLNDKQSSLDISEMENARLKGKVELALEERDEVLEKVREIERRFEQQLKDAIKAEQELCDKKIQLLQDEIKLFRNVEDSNERRISSLEQSNIADHNVQNVLTEQIAEEKAVEKIEEHKIDDHDLADHKHDE